MTDVVIDITPLGFRPPDPRDKAYGLRMWKAVQAKFPQAKRIEVNQWGRLVATVPSLQEQQSAAKRAVYALDLQQFREQLDARNGYGEEREHIVSMVESRHLPAAPTPLQAWPVFEVFAGPDVTGKAERGLEDVETVELDNRFRSSLEFLSDNETRQCRQCLATASPAHLFTHTDSCPEKPVELELLRRDRLVPGLDEQRVLVELAPERSAWLRDVCRFGPTLADMTALADLRARLEQKRALDAQTPMSAVRLEVPADFSMPGFAKQETAGKPFTRPDGNPPLVFGQLRAGAGAQRGRETVAGDALFAAEGAELGEAAARAIRPKVPFKEAMRRWQDGAGPVPWSEEGIRAASKYLTSLDASGYRTEFTEDEVLEFERLGAEHRGKPRSLKGEASELSDLMQRANELGQLIESRPSVSRYEPSAEDGE